MNCQPPKLLLIFFFFLVLLFSHHAQSLANNNNICIISSRIAGSSLANFIKHYTCTTTSSPACIENIRIFERNPFVGGRMTSFVVVNDTFEAGTSIIHPKNVHALRFASMLGLKHKAKSGSDSDSWFGIWDGSRFVFKTMQPPSSWSSFVYRKLYAWLNSLRIFRRYGFSLIRMNEFVKVITRLNYGQSISISGLAGAVSLAGSDSGL